MLHQICPVMPSRNFAVTISFFESIGFETQYRVDDQYLIMNRDAVEIHFAGDPGHRPETSTCSAYIRPADVDRISEEIAALDLPRDAGFPRFAPAEDRSWGMREAHLLDPDGHLFRFGQPLPLE